MPTLLRTRGYRFGFRASDRREPPHVHVIGNGGRAKFWMGQNVEIEWSRGYSKSQVGQISQIIEGHREAWLEAWYAFFG